MGSIFGERRGVNLEGVFAEAMAEAQRAVVRQLEQGVEQKLGESIALMLGRGVYARRAGVAPWVEMAGRCQRCKSCQSQRFSRNGGRGRTLETRWGMLQVWQQRLVCCCGGSVRLEIDGWLRPYQRIGEDVTAQIQRWGALRLSLREMQEELGQLMLSPLALRTLNQRLHQMCAACSLAGEAVVPPILQIDAIWATQLVPSGRYRLDSKGRRRMGKRRIKRPIFIALGVWPEHERTEVLAWRLADSEDEAAWLAFLSELEAQGIRGENGLALVIHDGGSGLCAALRTLHFGVAEQRCLFHKLRNLYHAIRIEEDTLTPKEKRLRKKTIFHQFCLIWQAKRKDTLLRRYLQVVRQYRITQPDAVRCLRTDFRATIAYFDIWRLHPLWPLTYLRTTSRLERFNRRLRRRLRAASAYHSDHGLCAMLAQEVNAFNPPLH